MLDIEGSSREVHEGELGDVGSGQLYRHRLRDYTMMHMWALV